MAGEERRLQILAVAVSLFSKRGFRGTTTKEIAQAAGVYMRVLRADPNLADPSKADLKVVDSKLEQATKQAAGDPIATG